MDFGSWGFKGLFQRALEIPSGVIPGVFTAVVSPTQRARIRYNDVLKQLEASIDGGPYLPFAGGAGGSDLATVPLNAPLALPAATDTTISTLLFLGVLGRPVQITETVELAATDATVVTFKFFRNGVEILPLEQYTETLPAGVSSRSVTVHWVDLIPGDNPTYTVTANPTVAAVSADERRITGIAVG